MHKQVSDYERQCFATRTTEKWHYATRHKLKGNLTSSNVCVCVLSFFKKRKKEEIKEKKEEIMPHSCFKRSYLESDISEKPFLHLCAFMCYKLTKGHLITVPTLSQFYATLTFVSISVCSSTVHLQYRLFLTKLTFPPKILNCTQGVGGNTLLAEYTTLCI